ncbi:hypothetical protein E2057_24175 [Escherichia coli]|nr:hypothetical protein [Escherichia coli]EEY4100255.1 hypothetical protein [Escherichia coli]EFA4352117.1 hypothetical protein [Escherichia coli]
MAAGFRRAKNRLILRRNALLNNLAETHPKSDVAVRKALCAVMFRHRRGNATPDCGGHHR